MSTENLYMNVYNRFNNNHQNLKETRMCFNKWTEKETVVCPYSGTQHSDKQHTMDPYNNIAES